MPKEIIYNKYGNTPENSEFVHIGWDRDCHVEVATVSPHGRLMAYDPETKTYVQMGDTPGWFIQLDRHGINEMIRVLRRARDAAYGKDE